MASLTICKVCRKQIATTAAACPQCGAPTVKSAALGGLTSIVRILFMVAAILSLLPCLLFLFPFGLIIPGVLFLIAVCLK